MAKCEQTTLYNKHLVFLATKLQFIDPNEGAGLRLGMVDWYLPSRLDKPVGNRFVMYLEDSTNGSEPPSFGV